MPARLDAAEEKKDTEHQVAEHGVEESGQQRCEGEYLQGKNQLLHVVGVGLDDSRGPGQAFSEDPVQQESGKQGQGEGKRALASTPARLQHKAEDKRIDQQEQERRDDDPDAAQHGVAITQFDLAPGHDQQEPDATGETGRYQEGTTHRKTLHGEEEQNPLTMKDRSEQGHQPPLLLA